MALKYKFNFQNFFIVQTSTVWSCELKVVTSHFKFHLSLSHLKAFYKMQYCILFSRINEPFVNVVTFLGQSLIYFFTFVHYFVQIRSNIVSPFKMCCKKSFLFNFFKAKHSSLQRTFLYIYKDLQFTLVRLYYNVGM